jgi:hypothetical protein
VNNKKSLKTSLAAEINVSRTDIWLWDEADALTAKSRQLARIYFLKYMCSFLFGHMQMISWKFPRLFVIPHEVSKL